MNVTRVVVFVINLLWIFLFFWALYETVRA